MVQQISRRLFLKASATAACSVAAGSGIARAAKAVKKGEPIATLLDIKKCIGCEECVYACKEVNEKKMPEPEKPFPAMYPARVPVEDFSEKREVTNRLTPYTWLYIQSATVEVFGKKEQITIPRRCMHCVNPPCVKLCPWGSAKQLDNGISRIDDELCLGGSKCKQVCPWHIPQRQTGVGLYLDLMPAFAGNGVMYKCDRCYDRIANGETPACIEVCPEDVQSIGPRSEIIEKAHALAEKTNGYIYGETENGGTNTIYVSPVPFDLLNKAITKGRGKPHFNKVKNMMAMGNNLAFAMIAAPFAGALAAFVKFYKTAKKEEKK